MSRIEYCFYIFSFEPQELGMWNISIEEQPDWILTAPTLRSFHVFEVTASGGTESDKNFGAIQKIVHEILPNY